MHYGRWVLARCRAGRYGRNVVARRAQTPITFRSDRAAARLKLLTRNGRSQAEVLEEALDRMPVPPPLQSEEVARLARIEAILDRFATARGPTMAEFDAMEYDENGDLR